MPDFDHNNVHSVEFEAPLSSDSIALAKKHFSIDLSLELERQLNMESFPPTPAHYSHDNAEQSGDITSHDSLDPQILVHIVKQLQHTLAEVTRDRDELREQIVLSHSREAELQDALQHIIDKATAMDVELTDARKKMKDDEEAIVLLRAKVEESRRGVMRIQAESRRQSLAPVDVTCAGIATFGSSPSAKRGTFTPMTGSFTARPGHRRIVSVNDSSANSGFDKAANPPTFTFPDNNASCVLLSSRRSSSLFGRTSPSPPEVAIGHDQLITQMEALHQELLSVKDVLEQTKHELTEANEAREASEMCVKVLREFIEESNVGATHADTASMTSLKLPPPPTMANGDGEEEMTFQSKKTMPSMSWGFGKLWGESTAKTSSNVPQSATLASPRVMLSPSTPISTTPLSRKIGDFFSSRTSSTGSVASTPARPVPPVAAPSMRESVHSSSDVSSVVVPASPPEEYNTIVVIQDVTNLSDCSAGNSPELDKEIKTQSSHQLQAKPSLYHDT